MFLENDYARPLFDFEKGGKPRAYLCLNKDCGKVTRTERGMRMHLKTVHDWEEQACLYSTDKQNDQNLQSGPVRKLRAGPPRLSQNENPPESTESTSTTEQGKSQETNEGELLKLMKGGN